MSLVEMHSVLARLYVDETFLKSFCTQPHEALTRYDLTPREAAALAGIDSAAVKKFASSLRFKTLGRFKHAYRLLLALDAAVTQKYYLRFYELRPIKPYETFYGPTIELGRFFERSFVDNPELPAYASDLARYERFFFQARFEPRVWSGSRIEPPATNALDAHTRLRLVSGIRTARFGYDMGVLEETLRKEEIPQEVVATECHVVFKSFELVGRAKKFQVSAPIVELLSQCNGVRDLGEVAASLSTELTAVLEASNDLLQLGLLEEAPVA